MSCGWSSVAKKKASSNKQRSPGSTTGNSHRSRSLGMRARNSLWQGARGYNTLPDSSFRKRWNIQLGGDSWMGTASVGWMIPVGWEFPALRPHPRESAEFWVLRVASGSSDSVGNSMFCVCSPPELLDPSVSLWY